MLGKVNIAKYTWLMRSCILEQNLLLPLFQPSIISNCTLNALLRATEKGSSHPSSKKLPFVSDSDHIQKIVRSNIKNR